MDRMKKSNSQLKKLRLPLSFAGDECVSASSQPDSFSDHLLHWFDPDGDSGGQIMPAIR
jgi:hypothetical protein